MSVLKQLDEERLRAVENAMPGDYWHEMCNPVCVVVATLNDHIIYADKKVFDSDRTWSWDTHAQLGILTRAMFLKKVRFASCEPKAHNWAPGLFMSQDLSS